MGSPRHTGSTRSIACGAYRDENRRGISMLLFHNPDAQRHRARHPQLCVQQDGDTTNLLFHIRTERRRDGTHERRRG